MENFIQNLILSDNKFDLEKIKTHFYFGKKVLNLMTRLPEKARFWHYGVLLWDIKDCFQHHYQEEEPTFSCLNSLHHITSNDLLCEEIWNRLEKKRKKYKILERNRDEWVEMIEVEQCPFYALRNQAAIKNIYIELEFLEKSKNLIKDLFWENYPNKKVHLVKDGFKISLKEDPLNESFETQTSRNHATRIKNYLSRNYGRSCLFYGPPGSGKSNLVKSIIKILDYKSITLDLSIAGNGTVNQIIDFFDPDVLVLEDINHMQYESLASLLNNMEAFNQRKKVILATANQVSELDPALHRPGRFDEMILISSLDDEVAKKLLEGDEELFQFTKNFPVVFMLELLKRVKVEGKEYALNNSKDLIDRVQNLKNYKYELLEGDLDEDEN